MKDTIRIQILKDGTLRVFTDQVSEANHFAADELVTALLTKAGGTPTFAPNPDATHRETLHTHIQTHTQSH